MITARLTQRITILVAAAIVFSTVTGNAQQLFKIPTGKKYSNGQNRGVWLYYGKKIKKAKQVGSEFYFENGSKRCESNLGTDGFYNNKAYYPSGKIRLVGKSIANIGIGGRGEWKEFYENGQVKRIYVFDNRGIGTGEWKEYHENGQLKSIGNRDGHYRQGTWKFYDENGELVKEVDYKPKDVLGDRLGAPSIL